MKDILHPAIRFYKKGAHFFGRPGPCPRKSLRKTHKGPPDGGPLCCVFFRREKTHRVWEDPLLDDKDTRKIFLNYVFLMNRL